MSARLKTKEWLDKISEIQMSARIKTEEWLDKISEIQMPARLNSNERHKINISKIC